MAWQKPAIRSSTPVASTCTSWPQPTPGPVKNWFDQSFTDMPLTLSAYLVTLQKTTPNPLLKESDEETAEGAEKAKEDSKASEQG